MNQKVNLLLIILILSAAAFSCSPSTPAQPTPSPVLPTVPVTVEPTPTLSSQAPLTEAEVPRVSLEDGIAAIQSGDAVVLDVRSPQAYQASHIPGALSVPLGEIETNPTGLNLDKDKWIITYCT